VSLLIGIDQSLTSTGIVVLNEEGSSLVGHHLVKTKPRQFSNIHYRLKYICSEVILALRQHDGGARIAIEGLSYGSVGQGTRDLAGLYFLLCQHLYRHSGVYPITITPTTLKRLATGSGAAKKPDIYAAMPNSMQEAFAGQGKGRFDLSDAYFLAIHATRELDQVA